MKASLEKKLPCAGVRFAAPVSNAAGKPAVKKMMGTRTATAPSIPSTCTKSVRTEARKPDQRVYKSTPPATMTTPWMKFRGESMLMSTPPARKFDIKLMRLPTTFEPASINWHERSEEHTSELQSRCDL